VRYRIDFSRLCRNLDEVIKHKQITDALITILKEAGAERATKSFSDFHNSLSEGHILDTMFVNDDVNLSGLEVLKRKIHPIYSEAILLSWDEVAE